MVYSVSVDPDGDTPERAKAFVKRRALDPKRVPLPARRRARSSSPVWRAYGIAPVNATPEDAIAAAEATDKFLAAAAASGQKLGRRPYEKPTRESPEDAADPYPDPDDLSYRGRSRHEQGLDFEHSAYVMLIDKHGRQRVGIPFEQLTVDGPRRRPRGAQARTLGLVRLGGGAADGAGVRAGAEGGQRRWAGDARVPDRRLGGGLGRGLRDRPRRARGARCARRAGRAQREHGGAAGAGEGDEREDEEHRVAAAGPARAADRRARTPRGRPGGALRGRGGAERKGQHDERRASIRHRGVIVACRA